MNQPVTEAVWTRTYEVDTLVVNPQKRLGLVGLTRILQDVAWIHGARLGHGFEAMSARGQAWVLARQKLVATDWPVWGETIEVATWVRPVSGMFVMRDYEVRLAGRTIAECTASWVVLDVERRRPLRFTPGDRAIGCREDRVLALEPAKLPIDETLDPLATFDVHNSDLDVNGHVNNTRYAGWILDALPHEAQRGRVVDEYEVNFIAETGVGDRIAVEWEGDASVDRDADRRVAMRFQGRRQGDGRIVFTARLAASPQRPGRDPRPHV